MVSEGPILHYMIGNIQTRDTSKGDVIFEYEKPNPQYPFKACHYIYLVYQQNEVQDFDEVKSM